MQTITVVIPTNRIDSWLTSAVSSVLDSEGVEVDLIVVFDGVHREDLPEWASDPRVRVLKHPTSMGPAAAMQTAVPLARGEYVARLDGDDVSHPDRLVRQAAVLNGEPDVVAVSSRTSRITSEGEPSGAVRLPAGEDVRHHLLLSNVIPHSTLMFRVSAWRDAGGYDSTLRQMEDYEFILRLGICGKLFQISDALVDYRVHASQTSRGAAPHGPHIRAVLAARRQLRRKLRASVASAELKNAMWVLAQWSRYWGITRPGHER